MQIFRPDGAPQSVIDWCWLKVTGPDSQDFLHRVSTAPVKALQSGEGASACFLTGRGTIEAWFKLWNTGASEYALEFEAGADGLWKKRLKNFVEHYTFAEKLQLSEDERLKSLWLFFADPSEQAGVFPELSSGGTLVLPNGLRACDQGSAQYGRPWVTLWGSPEQQVAWRNEQRGGAIEEPDWETLEEWRMSALRPRLGFEIGEATIPLEVGLVETVARPKGCYPGQEVIERISAMGAPPRKLVLLDGAALKDDCKSGAKLVDSTGAEVGLLTSISSRGSRVRALAIVRKAQALNGQELGFQGRPESRLKIVAVTP